MGIILVDKLPFYLDEDMLIEKLKLRKRKGMNEKLNKLMKKALKIAKPKGAYFETEIESRTENSVKIKGEVFNSRELAKATEKNQKLYPYIITCGKEIEEALIKTEDILEKYILDGIINSILDCATICISKDLKERYQIANLSYHIPGALNDWPIEDQQKLFKIFGDVAEKIGVELSESNVMKPGKSVSGVYCQVMDDITECI
ncbi:vitamin B12 dependent-methionine synthase activation domain-containing protein [Alkalibacter saccharofermentans]|uniref:Vitamin B12 dependent methionine synthase, activation domain n=1 Tax=Alkalibacter saccharofermentans DSM 14828 TaxID=1120975 RepID=A0A1M4XR76_9FIRM|nr:vitamin B12 dependent-methionine synthase activation domain-containing protein [Alkalibacter saccharofermentans]SHE95989.1 Vitamin B12 dependent methionine synthase, activation domain [Alkalibacter saccharofermentans DSM 14828]